MARLPNGSAGGDGLPPADAYKIAVDEYRFRARYNWSRTQYLLALNAAILAAATAVASRPGHSAALVFALGVAVAALSSAVVRVQHDYYRAARDRMRRVEAAIAIPEDQRIDTTATLAARRRLASVNQVVYLIFGAIGVADVVGLVLVALR